MAIESGMLVSKSVAKHRAASHVRTPSGLMPTQPYEIAWLSGFVLRVIPNSNSLLIPNTCCFFVRGLVRVLACSTLGGKISNGSGMV